MLELPELEVYQKQLNETIRFKKIVAVQINRPRIINKEPEEFIDLVVDELPVFIGVKGQSIVLTLGNGIFLVAKIALGSRLYLAQKNEKMQIKGAIVFHFLNGQRLYLINCRSSSIYAYHKEEMEQQFVNLGHNPLDREMTLEKFSAMLAERQENIKYLLTQQEFMGGIGRRYADEILFHAGLRPDREANDLRMGEISSLHSAILFILQEAILNGGCMDKPFQKDDQLTGGYNKLWKVFGREGDKCYLCEDQIQVLDFDGRESYFCPTCQK